MELNDPNVRSEGEVDDAQEFMHNKQIMIVPLLSGGGMRVKIIEGMASGKTIVSTSIGAEGISYTNGKNILIADSPDEIVKQLEKCLKDPAYCYSIGAEARKLAADSYSNESIGKKVVDFFRTLQ
jgi:glycosyltransferase involved in cell wall biosynthesis